MSDYAPNVRKYAPNAKDAAIATIVKYCGIALQKKDSSLVSCTDPAELERVRDGFAAKKLGLTPEAAEAAMVKVCAQMTGEHQKHRVTFYYLLAETSGTTAKLA